MRHRRTAATAGLLLLPLMTGCGQKSYCDTVTADQSHLADLIGSDGSTALLQALPIFSDLQSRAPGDVAPDWQLVVTRLTALRTALTDAHVDPAAYDVKQPPAGLSPTDRTAIRRAAAALAAGDTTQALQRVQQEVLDVCHTPLSL